MALKKTSNIPNTRITIQEFKRSIPMILANAAKNHYLMGFRKGGYQTDDSSTGWAKRKRDDKSQKRRGSRAILVKSGHLRNDFDIRRTTASEIVLGTEDTDYADYHNEGTEMHPKREFVGKSRVLDQKMDSLIKKKLKQVLR